MRRQSNVLIRADDYSYLGIFSHEFMETTPVGGR